ncbi:MAG: tyrosine-type recombinase/integrase [Clostridiales bacterium]|nr:tyrosine-type recombinase/integrase [Clostridiales bacterium]
MIKALQTAEEPTSTAVTQFEEYLRQSNFSKNTVTAYLSAVRQYHNHYSKINRKCLNEFKVYLIDRYKPQTINLRIRGINCYLEFLRRDNLKLAAVKTQQKPFLENVISEADYLYFKNCLLRDKKMYWYFVIRFLAATGARVSELTQIKAEHVKTGYLDLYSKGGKLRRIYIPAQLRKEATAWLKENGQSSGFIFVNSRGERMTNRGIALHLKSLGEKYGLDPTVIYPHSFRHRFAKSFLERYSDLSMLADLMGHESIETTRIYLRKTSTEQQAIIDRVVDW